MNSTAVFVEPILSVPTGFLSWQWESDPCCWLKLLLRFGEGLNEGFKMIYHSDFISPHPILSRWRELQINSIGEQISCILNFHQVFIYDRPA
jgi:hypothetical protein